MSAPQMSAPQMSAPQMSAPQMSAPQMSAQEQKLVQAYMAQLNDMERIVVNIAKNHLESSFSLIKSIGYQAWLKKQVISPES